MGPQLKHLQRLNNQKFVSLAKRTAQLEEIVKTAGIRKKVQTQRWLVISVVGFKETKEYLTSYPFRQEATDTRLTAQHCGSPEVEIPVIKCVCLCVCTSIKNSADPDSLVVCCLAAG